MNVCPHCHQPVAEDQKLCPHCGSRIGPSPEALQRRHVFDGCVVGFLLTAVLYFFLLPLAFFYHEPIKVRHLYLPPGQLQILQVVFRYGTWPINLVPLVIVGGLYLLLRRRYPIFARSLSYSLIVIGVLLLWGLATCRY